MSGDTQVFNRATFEASSSSSFFSKPSFKAQNLKTKTDSNFRNSNTNSFPLKSSKKDFPSSKRAKNGIFQFAKTPSKVKEKTSQSRNKQIESDNDSDASMEDAITEQKRSKKRYKTKKRKRPLQPYDHDDLMSNHEDSNESDSDDEEEDEESMPNSALFAPPQFYFQGRRRHQKKKNRSKYNSKNSKSNLPDTIWSYMHLLFNILVIFLFCYIVYLGFQSILNDIESKAEVASSDIVKEIGLCADNYQKNQCDDPNRPPALEDDCREWQKCMQRDPLKVARATLSAQTIAEVLNGFVEPLSYKSMFFLITFVLLFFFISNMAFNFVRGGTSRKRKKSKRYYQDHDEYDDEDDDDSFNNDNNSNMMPHQQHPGPPVVMPPAFQYQYPYYNYGYHPANTGGGGGIAPFLTPPPRNRVKRISRTKQLKQHGEEYQDKKSKRRK
eukprot:gb/GECH01000177.1/.p1 GENE.gb/GECH01000177.1/~~gb/GECH01000177.1/.p1  ORF type:complete len:440 (+),score=143.97 gb/GECH01000177.1/:1-1320(+)